MPTKSENKEFCGSDLYHCNTPVASADTASNTSQSIAPSAAGTSSIQDDSLICKWNVCNLKFSTAEALNEHLCERHVGRKSTNNLNLTCQWDSCRTTTVKRDHMTSHIRVHIPLKPHKCGYCGKSFKRPQDLKKHAKTHADDQADMNGAHSTLVGKAFSSYSHHNGHNRTNPAAFPHQDHRHASYSGGGSPTLSQSLGLRCVSTRGPQYLGHHAAASGFDTRKRAYDMDDDFFGSAKGHLVEHSSHACVNRSLMPLHDALALQTGGPIPATEHIAIPQQPGHTIGVNATPSGPSPLARQYYLPPMSNTHTKNDFIQINQILEQMQSTVYENTNQATHDIHVHSPTIFEYRHSYPSPPGKGHRGSAGTIPASQDGYAAAPAANITSPLTAISSTGTPALIPPSSNTSYASRQFHSVSFSDMSPHSTTSSIMYPNLPVTSSVFPGQSTTPTLGTNFDNNERRIYGGGMLQRTSPAPIRHRYNTPTVTQVKSEGTSTSPIGSHSSELDMNESSRGRGEKYEHWIKNMRTIETLREYIRDRIAREDFDEKTDERDERHFFPDAIDVESRRRSHAHTSITPPTPAARLYPIPQPSN